MIAHVCERAAASGAQLVAVATDDERIAAAVSACGFRALMTRADHASGTDRIAEAAQQLGLPEAEIVVNVQGDEPLIEPALVRDVAALLERSADAAAATACHPIRDAGEFDNPNVVKVVLDARGHALYFSRARIPFPRDGSMVSAYRHIGLYAYRAGLLARYASLQPSPLERIEQLEQLRLLWHGLQIAVHISATDTPPGVDTHGDLEAVRRMLS